jgi:hypothetical protein
MVAKPPMPLPMYTPTLRLGSVDFEPESARRVAAATANWMKRSIFLTSFFSPSAGIEALHLAAKRVECGSVEEA